MAEHGPGTVRRAVSDELHAKVTPRHCAIREDLTVIVTASPLPSHPSADIINETLVSVRHHLPDAAIWFLFDGVRPEQEHLREAYEQHRWNVEYQWGDMEFNFADHLHQVGMLRSVIDEIPTPLLMFVEADAPLLTDRHIDWTLITEFIQSGRSNCVRLYHEEVVPEAHRYLMFGMEQDAPMLRTSQYSARPHVATVEKYREWLHHFTPDANTFLEDLLHSVVQESVKHEGWWSQKAHIYCPDDDQGFRRSGHLDGRAGGPKFEAELRF